MCIKLNYVTALCIFRLYTYGNRCSSVTQYTVALPAVSGLYKEQKTLTRTCLMPNNYIIGQVYNLLNKSMIIS